MIRIAQLCAATVVISAAAALAQPAVPEKIAPPAATPAPRAAPMAMPDASPSTQAFKAADDQMMRAMDRRMTGDADQDFVTEMLPHHQGAVAMAKVELQYGKDPELRRLAQAIVAAQEKEITQMRTWRNAHPSPP